MFFFLTVDNSTAGFRPIREDPIGSSSASVLSSPTALHSPTSNIINRGGLRTDYRRSTIDYIDNNSIIDSSNFNNLEYGKGVREERLSHLMDKLQIDSNKMNGDRHNSVNRFATTNSLSNSILSSNNLCSMLSQDKLSNGDIKNEVIFYIRF